MVIYYPHAIGLELCWRVCVPVRTKRHHLLTDAVVAKSSTGVSFRSFPPLASISQLTTARCGGICHALSTESDHDLHTDERCPRRSISRASSSRSRRSPSSTRRRRSRRSAAPSCCSAASTSSRRTCARSATTQRYSSSAPSALCALGVSLFIAADISRHTD